MLDRRQFMLVYNADPARWAERYGIRPVTSPCWRCGNLLTTSIPIATKKLRGLVAPACTCGMVDTPYCVVSATRGKSPLVS